MALIIEQDGDNLVLTFLGDMNREDAHRYFDTGIKMYQEMGDAMGIILDLRSVRRISVSAMQTAKLTLKGVLSRVPAAIIGTPSPIFSSFINSMVALGRLHSQVAFHPNKEAAAQWLDEWFEKNQLDREALRGQVNIPTS